MPKPEEAGRRAEDEQLAENKESARKSARGENAAMTVRMRHRRKGRPKWAPLGESLSVYEAGREMTPSLPAQMSYSPFAFVAVPIHRAPRQAFMHPPSFPHVLHSIHPSRRGRAFRRRTHRFTHRQRAHPSSTRPPTYLGMRSVLQKLEAVVRGDQVGRCLVF